MFVFGEISEACAQSWIFLRAPIASWSSNVCQAGRRWNDYLRPPSLFPLNHGIPKGDVNISLVRCLIRTSAEVAVYRKSVWAVFIYLGEYYLSICIYWFILSILLFVVIGNHPLNECEYLRPVTRAPYIFASLANNNHRDDKTFGIPLKPKPFWSVVGFYVWFTKVTPLAK